MQDARFISRGWANVHVARINFTIADRDGGWCTDTCLPMHDLVRNLAGNPVGNPAPCGALKGDRT